MTPVRTLATAARVLRQLAHDPRSVALLLLMPGLLVGLFAWLFADQEGAFGRERQRQGQAALAVSQLDLHGAPLIRMGSCGYDKRQTAPSTLPASTVPPAAATTRPTLASARSGTRS